MPKVPLSLKDWLCLLKQRRMICHVEAFGHDLEEIKRSAASPVGYHACTEEGERIKFARFKATGALRTSRQVV
jgi:hypothetical protein